MIKKIALLSAVLALSAAGFAGAEETYSSYRNGRSDYRNAPCYEQSERRSYENGEYCPIDSDRRSDSDRDYCYGPRYR